MTRVRAALALLLAASVLVNIDIVEPHINVRWTDDVDERARLSLERRFGLEAGTTIEGTTRRYELRDRSRDNIQALLAHPAVDDTHDIDRSTLTVPRRELRVSVRGWSALTRATKSGVQSLVLVLCGGLLLWSARMAEHKRRRRTAVAVLLTAGALTFTLPLPQSITMGDFETYTGRRDLFEQYAGGQQIRAEAHLSYLVLGRLDGWYGRTDESPSHAFRTLTGAATVVFFTTALLLGLAERWSPVVVRYLGLVLLTPSALLYFGYQELGYLSLNLAVFPVLVRGLRTGGRALEVSGALSGFHAALHGFGLLSLAGAGLATLGSRARAMDRFSRSIRLGLSGLLAYLVWIPVYVLVLRLPLTSGHAGSIPMRPWLTDAFSEGRVNVAIVSAVGARDLLFTAWVAGVALLGVVASLWRQYPDQVRAALLYAVPSTAFLVVFWPVQGLGVEMDLVLAAFPACYALAWVCAHESRRATIAAVLLASAHIAFWRIVLDGAFVNQRLD